MLLSCPSNQLYPIVQGCVNVYFETSGNSSERKKKEIVKH